MGVLDDWNWQQDQSDYQPAAQDYTTSGNEYYSPYGGEQYTPVYDYQPTVYTASTPPEQNYIQPGEAYTPSDGQSILDTLQTAGKFMQSPGGNLLSGGLGALVSAYGATQQNKLNKKAQEEYQRQLAARQAKAEAYSSPLHLTMERQRVAGPVSANGGEASFFTNNKLPSFYAEGGPVNPEPGILNFLKYLLAGKKLPSEVYEEKQARMAAGRPQGVSERIEGYVNPQDRLEQQEKEQGLAHGGQPRFVPGNQPGQADNVDARLSPGEYVMDADTVSNLGDGNNVAGAKQLDHMREAIRTHKRSAPPRSIPPKAKSPLAYLKEKKHG